MSLTTPMRPLTAMVCIFGFLACRADAIQSVPANRQSVSIIADVGQEIRIVLGNVGPAVYDSPPGISSPAVTFLGVDVIPPYNPGGPTQQFRFKATRVGEAVVTFRRALGDSTVAVVEDTIQVR